MIVAFFMFLTWYKYQYSMDVVEPYTINSSSVKKKLLIATQGSYFKNTITEGIVNHYKADSLFIEVIDITTLENIAIDDYAAIIVIHTWENWKPPAEVKSFIEKTTDHKDKIVVLTTSGEGSYHMENVDAIVGESILADTPKFVDKIISRTTPILKSKS